MCNSIAHPIVLSHKKKEILPFLTTWMSLAGIMLSEISQTKTNTVGSHLHVKSNLLNSIIQRTVWWLPEAGGQGWMIWVKGVKKYKLLARK